MTKIKTEIEKRLDKLEDYVAEEMDNIRKLAKTNVVLLPKVKDLFTITDYKEA